MPRFILLATGLLGAIVASCAPVAEEGAPIAIHNPPIKIGGNAMCDASRADHLIGSTRSEEIETQLKDLTGARLLRWASEGSALTMEYSAERLTIIVNEGDGILSMSCG